jgi:hypothetical protein
MGNEERKDAVGTNANDVKVGEVVGPETATRGSELVYKLSYDGLSEDADTIIKSLRQFAKEGNIPSLKALMEYADKYVRRAGAPVSRESLGLLLLKALEEESEGGEQSSGIDDQSAKSKEVSSDGAEAHQVPGAQAPSSVD